MKIHPRTPVLRRDFPRRTNFYCIFLDGVDRHDFLKALAKAFQKTCWQVHPYSLMPNHDHLVVETPDPNLVAGMAWLQSTYTIRLNPRRNLIGHVLSGGYKAQLVEGSGDGCLETACDYVHLNPVRAQMLKLEERLLSYPWSSFGSYLAAPEHRPSWIRVDRLLGEHGIQEDTAVARQRFKAGGAAAARDDSFNQGHCRSDPFGKFQIGQRQAAPLHSWRASRRAGRKPFWASDQCER